MEKITFEEWMRLVDSHIARRCGLTSDDLADGSSWDSWNSGMDPEEYADELLASEGFPLDDDW
jgi:hypothetical protein